MTDFLIGFVVTFVGCAILVPVVFAIIRLFGLYAIVPERTCFVYVLFGKVLAVLDEPGLHFLPARLGWRAGVVRWRAC